MINYDPVLRGLYDWHRKLQITQKTISAKVRQGSLEFDLEHPLNGTTAVRMPVPTEEYFRAEGIGLRLAELRDDRAVLHVYDYGGILDPVDGCVQGEHYSASHFAWMAAILYADTGEDAYLDDARRGVEFHLNTRADEYRFASWAYHHEFNNYAFAEIVMMVRDSLSEEERRSWLLHLRRWENTRNRTANWCAMRALAYSLRHDVTNSPSDWLWHKGNLLAVELSQLRDGCFDDMRGVSRPVQYHAYVAALLGRLYELRKSESCKRRFVKAARYLAHFVDPEGNFNYKGRGQGQIFGYGNAAYVFELARLLDSENEEVYETCLQRVWQYLTGYQQPDGHFPLVLTSHSDDEGFGWYDYHHTTVYNAFLGAWLAMARRVAHSRDDVRHAGKLPAGLVYLKPSGVIRYAGDGYFCVLSAGEMHYPADAGVALDHLWIKGLGAIISCPGGPTPESYGAKRGVPDIAVNYSTPLIRPEGCEWISPAHRRARIRQLSDNEFVLMMDYDVAAYERCVRFEERRLSVTDTLRFTTDLAVDELRLLSLPLLSDNVQVECSADEIVLSGRGSADNQTRAAISVEAPGGGDLTMCETVPTAAGVASVIAVISKQRRFRPGDRVTVEWHVAIGGGSDGVKITQADAPGAGDHCDGLLGPGSSIGSDS